MKFILTILIFAQLCMPAQAMWHAYVNTTYAAYRQQIQKQWQYHAINNPLYKYSPEFGYTILTLGTYAIFKTAWKAYGQQISILWQHAKESSLFKYTILALSTGILGFAIYKDYQRSKASRELNLFEAIHTNNLTSVQDYLQNKPDLNKLYMQLMTPLHLASSKGHAQIVQTLLQHKAEVNLQGERGLTALHFASIHGYSNIVGILLEYKANPNLKNNDDVTALMAASKKGHPETVKILLQHNAQPNMQDHEGWTALHFAATESHPKVVETLLQHKADPNIQDNISKTPLHYASHTGCIRVVKTLLYHNANPNVQDNQGNSSLHIAVDKGLDNNHAQIVTLLLKQGANQRMQNKKGIDSLEITQTIKPAIAFACISRSLKVGIDAALREVAQPILSINTIIKALMAYRILEAQRQGNLESFMQKYKGYNTELANLYQDKGEQGILGFCYKTLGIKNTNQPNIFKALQEREYHKITSHN